MGLKSDEELITQCITAEQERAKVYCFRYRNYFEGVGHAPLFSQAKTETAIDSRDRDGLLFASYSNDKILGTCRVSFSSQQFLEDTDQIYDLSRFEKIYPKGIALIEHFLIRPDAQDKEVLLDLIQTTYREVLNRNVDVTIIGCWMEEQIQMLIKLGFRLYMGKPTNESFKALTPLILFNNDGTHLRLLESPLFEILAESKTQSRMGNDR